MALFPEIHRSTCGDCYIYPGNDRFDEVDADARRRRERQWSRQLRQLRKAWLRMAVCMSNSSATLAQTFFATHARVTWLVTLCICVGLLPLRMCLDVLLRDDSPKALQRLPSRPRDFMRVIASDPRMRAVGSDFAQAYAAQPLRYLSMYGGIVTKML